MEGSMSELNTLFLNLEEKRELIKNQRFITAFDGFIDQMIKVVDKRDNLDHFNPVQTMTRFAQLIGQASQRSSLREIVIESEEIGGCAVNMSDALISLGSQLDFYGTTGKPMNKAFSDFASRCFLFHSLKCDPELTMALEFDDGKYMLSSVSQLAELNRAVLVEELKDDQFLESCRKSELLALTNWTLYPHMTDCWSYIQDKILSSLEGRPYIFVDLVDPRSRSQKDIGEMLGVLSGFERYGNTILGGNLNEGNVLAELLGLEPVAREGEAVAHLAAEIRNKLQISMVALHCIGGSSYADETGQYWAEGPYCNNPVKSTGAGDRYNAGFCLATVLGLEPREILHFASAVSGYFVRNGCSGTLDQVKELISQWNRGEL
jgi:ketohexokinase